MPDDLSFLLQQKQVEQEEEFLVNKLSKRLNQLKREKQTLANEVEQEEEYLVNNLQKRLAKVRPPFLTVGSSPMF